MKKKGKNMEVWKGRQKKRFLTYKKIGYLL